MKRLLHPSSTVYLLSGDPSLSSSGRVLGPHGNLGSVNRRDINIPLPDCSAYEPMKWIPACSRPLTPMRSYTVSISIVMLERDDGMFV